MPESFAFPLSFPKEGFMKGMIVHLHTAFSYKISCAASTSTLSLAFSPSAVYLAVISADATDRLAGKFPISRLMLLVLIKQFLFDLFIIITLLIILG